MNLLDFIEKHKIGIVGTLAVHMFIFICLNIGSVEYGIYKAPDHVLAVMDFREEPNQEPEETENLEHTEENDAGNNQDLANVAANRNNATSQFTAPINKAQLDREVWEAAKALEKSEYDKVSADNPKLEKPLAEAPMIDLPTKTNAEKNDNAGYGRDILATAEYEVKNRHHLQKNIPAYKCRTEGVVRVNIKVSQKGKILDVSIDESKTNTSIECLRSEALNSARKWVFNQNYDEPLKRDGWIEFRYVAQKG